MKLKVIITGATGMVGESVLHECLNHNEVDEILIINRKPAGITHPKLKEIILTDFFGISQISDQLKGYNACFFCLGVSSVGMKEEEYFRLTYSLTINFAQVLSSINKDMTFCYISGSATDSTEHGKSMWARIKGKTENDLMKLPFKNVYNFRPAYMHPTKGLKNTLSFYKYISWIYPIGRSLFPNYFTTLKELGLAMINSALYGYDKQILEVKDIVQIAENV
jgi:saccharopine dehydrogenase-like NADP-dependent oxidoreductase